jgi:NAD kinase
VIDAIVFRSTLDAIELDSRMRIQLKVLKQNDEKVTVSEGEGKQLGKLWRTPRQFELLALNEVTIMRNDENMLQVEVCINDVQLTIVQGDG